MKIVQIFPGKIWGGAEQYVLDLGFHLIELGHDVVFVAIDSPQIRKCLSTINDVHFLPFGLFKKRTLANLIYIAKNADVIHIHDFQFLPYVCKVKQQIKDKSLKIIATRHIARGNMIMPWKRKYFSQIHRLVFVSNLAKSLWIEYNCWFDKNRCVVIHNSIPEYMSDKDGLSLRRTFNISSSVPLLVFSGRVRKSKGCELIVNALGKLKDCDFSLVFIGNPKPLDYNEKLMSIAKMNGIEHKIHFFGFTLQARLLIQEADVGLAPSLVREACPLSPMEFMQNGVCVIASGNGAQKEYIESGVNGILINTKSVDELALAIRKVIKEPEYRNIIAQNGKRYFVERMQYKTFISKIIDIYFN